MKAEGPCIIASGKLLVKYSTVYGPETPVSVILMALFPGMESTIPWKEADTADLKRGFFYWDNHSALFSYTVPETGKEMF